MDKATLLNMLRANRTLFDRTLALVGEAQMLGADGEERWSGADIVGHITTWEQRLIGWLAAAARSETPQIPEPGATWDDMDWLNARDYAANRDPLPAEALEASRRSFQQLLAQVEAFSEEQLIEPGRFAWMEGAPLWRRIAAGPGYGHYQAHLYDLLQRIDRAARHVPAPSTLERCAGVYSDGEGALTVRVDGDALGFDRSWEPGEKRCLALDDTRFAYESGGLLTFRVVEDGTATSVEIWSYVLPRVEGREGR